MHWEDIDEEGGIIHFNHSQYHGRRRKLTKTHRYIQRALTPKMSEVLQEHRERIEDGHPAKGSPIVFPAWIDPKQSKWGGYMSRAPVASAMERVARELEIPRVVPHDMRRTFNTLMLENGVSPEVLKAMTGHSTDQMMIHYAHISREHKAEAVEKLLAAITQTDAPQG